MEIIEITVNLCSRKVSQNVNKLGDTGLEPVAFAMSTQCSNQLS